MTKVSNCGHDSRWLYSGDKAGDQTGDEWYVRDWYSFGQNVVLRHPDQRVQQKIASMATDAANNDAIGYDQGERDTFWKELSRVGYIPSHIATLCEADCSSGVMAIVKAVGHIFGIEAMKGVPYHATTHNMVSYLRNAGFVVLSDRKYLSSGDYLLAGDINVNEATHTNICVTSGPKSSAEDTVPDLLAVDGYIGRNTISEWQSQCGTPVDGIVSGQSTECRLSYPRLTSVQFGEGGSSLMMAVQDKVGVKGPTGVISYGTVGMLQGWLMLHGYDCSADNAGILGEATAKAVQLSLNDRAWK